MSKKFFSKEKGHLIQGFILAMLANVITYFLCNHLGIFSKGIAAIFQAGAFSKVGFSVFATVLCFFFCYGIKAYPLIMEENFNELKHVLRFCGVELIGISVVILFVCWIRGVLTDHSIVVGTRDFSSEILFIPFIVVLGLLVFEFVMLYDIHVSRLKKDQKKLINMQRKANVRGLLICTSSFFLSFALI